MSVTVPKYLALIVDILSYKPTCTSNYQQLCADVKDRLIRENNDIEPDFNDIMKGALKHGEKIELLVLNGQQVRLRFKFHADNPKAAETNFDKEPTPEDLWLAFGVLLANFFDCPAELEHMDDVGDLYTEEESDEESSTVEVDFFDVTHLFKNEQAEIEMTDEEEDIESVDVDTEEEEMSDDVADALNFEQDGSAITESDIEEGEASEGEDREYDDEDNDEDNCSDEGSDTDLPAAKRQKCDDDI